MIFADIHSAAHLKQACMNFLLNNHKKVMKTKQWKSFHDLNPRMSSDIFEWILNDGKGPLTIKSHVAYEFPTKKEDTLLVKVINVTTNFLLFLSLSLSAVEILKSFN